MTDIDSIAELIKPVVFPSTLCSYTVSYVTNYPKHDRLPALILKGQWLEKASLPSAKAGGAGDGGVHRAHYQIPGAGV